MVATTALLMRERGARATSIDAVLEHSGAPRGSIYHHFPGGREQLLREATDYAGESVAERLERHAGEDPLAAVDWMVREYSSVLRATEFRAGCPIVAVAVEGGGAGPDLMPNVRGAFNRWRDLIERACERAGIHPRRSRELALITIAAVEGALILCRAYSELEPLQIVGRELHERLASELAAATRSDG
jgi:AcrR family transcriptional regulator